MGVSLDFRSDSILRARVRTTASVTDARRRTSAAVGACDLRPRSLPHSAILVVRRARVSQAIGTVDNMAARERFTGALESTLADLARAAARPAYGDDGPCGAVLFADVSELLACLARDWVAGVAADRWWWRAIGYRRITLDAVVQAWLDRPEHIAVAFMRLRAQGASIPFAALLEPRHVRAIGTSLMTIAGGGKFSEVSASAPRTAPTRAYRHSTDRSHAAVAALVRHCAREIERSASMPLPLRRDQRALLLVAGIAAHAPALMSEQAIADVIREHLDDMPGASSVSRARAAIPAPVAATEPSLEDRERPMASGPSAVRDADALVTSQAAITHAVESRVDESAGQPPAATTEPSQLLMDAADDRFVLVIPLGGIFYLLNILIAMRLYGDFSAPKRRRLPFSPWRLIALVAEEWLGEPLDAATAALLARLDHLESPGARETRIDGDRVSDFVRRIVRRISRRVARALDEPEGVGSGLRLLRHDARVHLSGAHVDAMLDLASLPIPIRIAGFDRDPGWVPAAGRIVRLHFS